MREDEKLDVLKTVFSASKQPLLPGYISRFAFGSSQTVGNFELFSSLIVIE